MRALESSAPEPLFLFPDHPSTAPGVRPAPWSDPETAGLTNIIFCTHILHSLFRWKLFKMYLILNLKILNKQ